MKRKNDFNKVVSIIIKVLFYMLLLFWFACIVLGFFGAFFTQISNSLEVFFKFKESTNLLSFSQKYLIFSSIGLVVVLLFDDLKIRFLKN